MINEHSTGGGRGRECATFQSLPKHKSHFPVDIGLEREEGDWENQRENAAVHLSLRSLYKKFGHSVREGREPVTTVAKKINSSSWAVMDFQRKMGDREEEAAAC